MARVPQTRAAQLSAEDDFYEEDGEIEGQGSGGQDGAEGAGEIEDDATLNFGEEQEAGQGEDVDADLADFFDDAPQRSPSRGETRQQRLANENRRLAERIALLEQGRQQAGITQPAGPRGETEQEFEARLQMLEPVQQLAERQKRFEQTFTARANQTYAQATNLADKTAFDSKSHTDGRYVRWAERVETEHQKFLQQGMFVPRENVLFYLAGKALFSREGSKGLKQARQAAARRVDRNTVRASNAGSDVRPARRGQETEAQARARRLDGINI